MIAVQMAVPLLSGPTAHIWVGQHTAVILVGQWITFAPTGRLVEQTAATELSIFLTEALEVAEGEGT
jgi:hypothetical protein